MNAVAMGTMTDVEGFDRDYDSLFRELSVLARALGAGSDAEDVAQEALLEGRRRLDRLHDREKLRPWLRRIAVRGACRARARRRSECDPDHVERLPVGDRLDVTERLDVAAAIAGLPERERVAVTLVYGLGYAQDEAAELMGVAPGTVYSSVWRARQKLARLLAVDDDVAARTPGRRAR